MDDRSLEVFARLLAADSSPNADRFDVVDRSDDFYESSDRRGDAQEAIARLTQRGTELASEIEASWGPPAFSGAVRESAPTEWAYWRCFVWMAYWPRPGCLAFVAVCHQDTELPVMLLLGLEEEHPV